MPKYLWERLKPVDFIVEGHDQIRGWFFSLLRSGVIGFGERLVPDEIRPVPLTSGAGEDANDFVTGLSGRQGD